MTPDATRPGLLSRSLVRIGLACVLIWTLVPLIWMVLSSFKPASDLTADPPKLTFHPTLDHYRTLFSGGNGIGGYVLHSLVASGVSTIIAVVLGCMAGYGLARSSFRGKDHVAFWIISTRMAPIAAMILPLFIIFRGMGVIGSVWSLIIAYLTFNLPFAIWIMNAFFSQTPPALEEAAMVDGASRWQAFYRIALPLTLPGIATTAILCLVFSWNDYAFASTFSGPASQTLPIAASQLVTQTSIDWGQLTAIGTIVVAPMIIVGLAVRRWLVTGLTLGAVTGE
jgi:multiple sugar transport system permease protein